MPVYKGTNEVTSGNLYKGSTEIQDGYKATDSFYVNEVTLTIAFIDNTGSNISLTDASSVSFTGIPGTSWTSFSRNVSRTNGTVRITGAAGNESGDTQNILNIVESGSGRVTRTLAFSGTLPTTTQTITVTVTSTSVNLQTRTLYVGPGGTSTSEQITIGRVGWSGGGNGTISVSTNYSAGQMFAQPPGFPDGLCWQHSGSGANNTKWFGNADLGIPNYTSGSNVSPSSSFNFINKVNQTGGSQTSRTNTLIVSVEETDVYQAQSASASYTRTS